MEDYEDHVINFLYLMSVHRFPLTRKLDTIIWRSEVWNCKFIGSNLWKTGKFVLRL